MSILELDVPGVLVVGALVEVVVGTFWYKFNRFGPPQICVESPAQVI